MISFRTLARTSATAIDGTLFTERLRQASRLRRVGGVYKWSHRLVYAEGDFLPGLIIDRFRLQADQPSQVFVVQSSTAGMDALLPLVMTAIEALVHEEAKLDESDSASVTHWRETAVILANDSKSRAAEGIKSEPKRVEKTFTGFEPTRARLIAEPSHPGLSPVVFESDLIGGQKTGFFLDQRMNIQFTSRCLAPLVKPGQTIRILDLCCYIGQWGSHLANLVTALGGTAEVTCVDASAKALELAVKNVSSHGGVATAEKADVLESLDRFERASYDVVICDPPAFIKKKKDVPAGSQAYYKLNREALRKTKPGGLYVSCSCSGLLSEEEFREMLARVTAVSVETRWLARGSHGPDHPQRPEFPQGTYLKSWIGSVV